MLKANLKSSTVRVDCQKTNKQLIPTVYAKVWKSSNPPCSKHYRNQFINLVIMNVYSFCFHNLVYIFANQIFNWISYYNAALECLISVENLYSKITISKILNFQMYTHSFFKEQKAAYISFSPLVSSHHNNPMGQDELRKNEVTFCIAQNHGGV